MGDEPNVYVTSSTPNASFHLGLSPDEVINSSNDRPIPTVLSGNANLENSDLVQRGGKRYKRRKNTKRKKKSKRSKTKKSKSKSKSKKKYRRGGCTSCGCKQRGGGSCKIHSRKKYKKSKKRRKQRGGNGCGSGNAPPTGR